MPRDARTLSLVQLNDAITRCTRCPRLTAYGQTVAQTRRAAYRTQTYWARPVPNFLPDKPARARLLIVGLAPGAHGAHRTGRMFTGDKSGDFLFPALHAAGFASQPISTAADDGLTLRDAVITAAGHCAPPDNKPARDELAACASFLDATIDAMPRLTVTVTLGRIAHDALLRRYADRGWVERVAQAPFAHGAAYFPPPAAGPAVLCSYHPSQQNTFTGRLTLPMLTGVFLHARRLIDRPIGPI